MSQQYQNRNISASADSASDCQAAPPTAEDLQRGAIILIDALFNTRDLSLAAALLSPVLHFQHDSACNPVTFASREEFMSFWEGFQKAELAGQGECRIKEAAVDELQRKVWIVGEIGGVNSEGGEKEGGGVELLGAVEMLTFDRDGRVCEIQDSRRKVRVRMGEDD